MEIEHAEPLTKSILSMEGIKAAVPEKSATDQTGTKPPTIETGVDQQPG